MGCLLVAAILTGLLVVGLTILWKISSAARYYLKFSSFCVLSMIFATVPIPLMLFRPRDSRNALLPAKGCRFCKLILGITCSVKGTENIVKDSGAVLLLNHQSGLDLLVLAELWPVIDNCAVISKKEIFYIWPFGLASWLWGTIFIDRLSGEKAHDCLNRTGEIIKKRKARVLMFPEGTRNLKDKLLPFKKGAFHLAVASGCPLQPIAVSRYTFLGPKRFDSGHISINILPPIPTEGLSKDDIPDLIGKTHKIMSDYLDNSATNGGIHSNSQKLDGSKND